MLVLVGAAGADLASSTSEVILAHHAAGSTLTIAVAVETDATSFGLLVNSTISTWNGW